MVGAGVGAAGDEAAAELTGALDEAVVVTVTVLLLELPQAANIRSAPDEAAPMRTLRGLVIVPPQLSDSHPSDAVDCAAVPRGYPQ